MPRARGRMLQPVLLCALVLSGVCLANDELTANRDLWEAAGIVSYEYRYEKVCDCHRDTPAETIVTVERGLVVGVRYDRDDYRAEIPVAENNYRWFRTIDDLFTLVETASRSAVTLRVAYEAELGYPAYIYIDYDQTMVGDEVELRVVSLRAAADASAHEPLGKPLRD